MNDTETILGIKEMLNNTWISEKDKLVLRSALEKVRKF